MLTAKDVSCSPVRSVADVLAWPQMKARRALVPLRRPDGMETSALAPGFPFKLSNAATEYAPAPVPGAHTAEILSRFVGVDSELLQELRQAGVV
jgi:formyl-CoA transferase